MILKIKDVFEDIFEAHPSVSESSFDEYKALNLESYTFPLIQGVLDSNIDQTQRGQEVYEAEFMVLDVIEKDESDKDIVLLKTKRIADDISNLLLGVNPEVFGFTVNKVTKHLIRNPDIQTIVGTRCQVTIDVEEGYDNCSVNLLMDKLIEKYPYLQ